MSLTCDEFCTVLAPYYRNFLGFALKVGVTL
jgi:hypothetical protein